MHAPISRRLVVRCRRASASISGVGASMNGADGAVVCDANASQCKSTRESPYVVLSDSPTPSAFACGSYENASPTSSRRLEASPPRVPTDWEGFRRRYEARYLGAFDSNFVRNLVRSAPVLAARLACSLTPSNPRHVANLLEIFGEMNFQIGQYASRAERKTIAKMLTHPSLGPNGSAWLFNEIQQQLIDWECTNCGSLNVASAVKCKHCSNCSHIWECDGCGLQNRSISSVCEGCGGMLKRNQMTAFRWRCESCSFINLTGRLTCSRCTARMPLPASPRDCDVCHSPGTLRSCFPWCDVCGAAENEGSVSLWACSWCAKENHSLTQLCEGCGEERRGHGAKPWYQWRCEECATANPFWATACRNCRSDRRSSDDASSQTLCASCGSVSVVGESLLCSICSAHACSKWVCLSDACIGVNEGADSACRRCGTAPVLVVSDDSLKWSATNLNLDGMAVSLQSSQGTICAECGHEVPPLSLLCPQCSSPHPPSTRIASWVALKALHDVCADCLSDCAHNPQKSITTAVSTILSVAKSLCATPLELLPWTGVDIETGHACESSTSPVTWGGRRHFGIRTLSDVILSMVSLGSVFEAGTPNWRSLMRCCLDLVDLSNRSTEFDELGFEVLSKICMAVRPSQERHIDEDTRIFYLVNMKLSRKAITNGVACPICLSLRPENCGCFDSSSSPSPVVDPICVSK